MSLIDYRKTGRCPYCDQWIAWCTVEGQPDIQMPVDRWPSERGNIRVDIEHGRLWARVLEDGELAHARQADAPLYRSHYATCSQTPWP